MGENQVDMMDVNMLPDKRVRFEGQESPIPGKEIAVQRKKHFMKGPTMLLTGHDAEIFTAKFHPTGTAIASAGVDRSIYLWTTRGDCENYAILKAAHSNTILEIAYSPDGNTLFSCSADKLVIIWDSTTGCRLKKLRNHQSHVNSISTPAHDPNLLASVGDDRYINIWDVRTKRSAMSFKDNYQLTSVAFSNSGDQVYVGGIENIVNVWDLRRGGLHKSLAGHDDTITGLSVSPDGNHLLSNSIDNSMISWDIRPSAPIDSYEKKFIGHQHNFEKNLLRCSWSKDGSMVTAGSSDGLVYIWNYNSCDIIYKLPGHRSSVNEVVFSPREPLVLSCSSDKQMYLGELDPPR